MFARAERNQLQIRRRSVDLDQLVRDVVERFRPALENSGLEIEVSTNVGQPLRLDADVIEQILDNLISNVQRYAAEGKYLSVRSDCEGPFGVD